MNTSPEAILVLPRLRIQNANAISSPLTHGFPSITAFIGMMWALQRKMAQRQIPLQLLHVGVICHQHQEHATNGYVRTFNLRKPNVVTKKQAAKLEKGEPPAIVEEGCIHLQLTLVFSISLQPGAMSTGLYSAEQRAEWVRQIGQIITQIRVAGGTVQPSHPMPRQQTQPWLEPLAEEPEQRAADFRRWRRQWLPGFALVSRDDVLATRLEYLRASQPEASLLDAWLHVARFNYRPVSDVDAPNGNVKWQDPLRPKGSGWLVPITVGYAALTERHEAGIVRNARDMSTPVRFVESVYSIGEWISPHRLDRLEQLLWWPEIDETTGLYRCRNAYQVIHQREPQLLNDSDMNDEEDEDEFVEDD